jgi:hypothetical protein
MSVTTVDPAIAKILNAIQRKGETATITDIKRSIAEFNQDGGVEKLRKYLADLVAKGILTPHKTIGSRGHTIEAYSLAKSKAINGSHSSGNTASTTNLTIAVTLDTTLEGLLEIVHSLISVEDGNEPKAKAPDSPITDKDDPVEDTPAPPMPTVPAQQRSRFPTNPGKPMPPRFNQSAPPPRPKSSQPKCDDAPDDCDDDSVPF